MDEKYKAQAEAFASFLIRDTSKGQRKRKGDRVEGRCPTTHEDKHPSFSYMVDTDGWACSCGSGKGSELRSLLGWASDTNGNGKTPYKPNVSVLAPIPFSPPPKRDPDCIHVYNGGNRKLRWYLPDGTKNITWEHAVGDKWVSGKQGEVGLYNESKIASSDTVYLSESETDADEVSKLNLVSTCHGFGASSNLKDEQAALFKRKKVPILEHADDAGRKWSAAQLQILTKAGADAWVVQMPEPHKDIRDYIKAGADRFAVEFLAQAFEPKELIAESAPKLFERTPDTIDYIVEPILSKGCILQLQGNPKGGKSSFALMLAISCALGRWTAGRFNFVGSPRRTLYLGYEDSARRMKRRSKSYLTAMGITDGFPENLILFQRAPDLDLATEEGQAKLDKIIRKNNVEVVIIDTLSWVAGGDENTKKDMQPVLATLRYIAEEYGTAVVLIHHTRKTSQNGDMASVSERGRGSSAIAAAADSIIDWGSRVSPNHTLCRLISKDTDEDEFIVAYKPQDDGSIGWQIEDVVEREDSVAAKQAIRDALKQLLTTSPTGVLVSSLSKAIPKIAENTIRSYLKQMEKDGELMHEIGPRKAWLWLFSLSK